MKKVKIDFVTMLSSCPICKKADETIRKILESYGDKIDINHLDMAKASDEDIGQLRKKYGVLMTPFIAINGKVFVNGKSPDEDDLRRTIEGEF